MSYSIRIRSSPNLILARAVVILSLSGFCTLHGAGEEFRSNFLSLYLREGPMPAEQPAVSVSAQGLDTTLRGAPVRLTPRTILLLVDPASNEPDAIKRRVGEIGRAISRISKELPQPIALRLGIPVLDGVLGSRLTGEADTNTELAGMLESYLSDQQSAGDSNFGRTLDLMAGVLRQAEESDGPVDCIILARDRRIIGEHAKYLISSVERQVFDLVRRKGSTLYGLLSGSAVLEQSIVAAGGVVFPERTPAEEVARSIIEWQGRGYLVEVVQKGLTQTGTRFALTFAGRGADGRPLEFRSARALWLHPGGEPIPDQYHVGQGLDWIRRARDAENDGNLTLSMRFLENSLRDDQWNAEAFYMIGRVAEADGLLPIAESHLIRAVQLDPGSEHILVLFGRVSEKLGKAQQALGIIQSSIGTRVQPTPALNLQLGRLLTALARYGEASDLYAGLLGAVQSEEIVRAEYGGVLWKLGRKAEALQQLDKALELNSDCMTALIQSSAIAAEQGKVPEAIEFAARALQVDPRSTEAHITMGNAQGAGGSWDQAAGHYRSAQMLAPARSDVIGLLVSSLRKIGQQSEAVEILQRYIQAQPGDAEAYRKLAEVLESTGEISEAVSTLESGSARVQRRADTLLRDAAELRERRGEYGQALLNYRAMLLSSPPDVARSRGDDLSHHLSYLKLLLGRNPTGPGAGQAAGPAPADRSEAEPGAKQPSMPAGPTVLTVPGGLNLLARTLGVQPSLLAEADALERIFSFMIEMSPSHSEKVENNPIRRDVMTYLRHYDALLTHMKKQRLLPGDFDPSQGQEFSFFLNAEGESFERTQKFLSFFGINAKTKKGPDGSAQVTLVMKQSRTALERQTLLRNMGTNLLDRNLREIRITLRDDTLPIVLGEPAWSQRILAGEKAKSLPLLGRIVVNHRALRLYLALAGCAESTRNGLVQSIAGADLLKMADVLGIYGRYLEFQDGKLKFPGSRRAWEELLGHSGNEGHPLIAELLSRDDGRAMMVYYALSLTNDSAQQTLTSSGAQLMEVYRLLTNYYQGRVKRGPAVVAGRDLGSLLRRLSADEQGLYLDVDPRFARFLLPSAASRQQERRLHIRMEEFESLLKPEQGSQRTGPLLPVVQRLEFIQYLQASYPESIDAETIEIIMEDPEQSRLFLDLVWDLGLPAKLIKEYVFVCRDLAASGSKGWNDHRTRTTQSLAHLVSLLHRQGSLPRESARELLARMLSRMSASDEPEFAFGVAGFISDSLLPALEKAVAPGPSEVLLRGLAGAGSIKTFLFQGKQLQFDPVSHKLRRMEGAIQQQRYVALKNLVEIYRLLRLLRDGKPEADTVDSLARALKELRGVDPASVNTAALREAVARANLPDLLQKAESLRSRGSRSSSEPQIANEIASALHVELGITLLAYCYAFHGSPETDALAFDANFVRKHSFYSDIQSKNSGWRPAVLEQKEGIGVHVVGSLSGLGYQLSSLETSQAVQSFGKREGRSLVPTILSGFRAMRRSMLSDRTQEYVALSVRMGREVLALSGTDDAIGSWCETELRRMLPPRRRERIFELLKDGNAGPAAEVLSPSELLALGESFLGSFRNPAADPVSPSTSEQTAAAESVYAGNGHTDPDTPPSTRVASGIATTATTLGRECPVFDRLRQITPSGKSEEGARFRRELQEYGVLLRKRIGLNQLSLMISDSYEQLETGAVEEVLYERICDLKLRLAELNHALGLPAFLGEVEGELAVRDILPQNAAIRTNNWKLALEQIGRLDAEHAEGWVEELLNRGVLTIGNGAEAGK